MPGRRQFGEVVLLEQTAPSTPASGLLSIYAKSDGILYYKNDAGTEVPVTAAGAPSYPLLAPNGLVTNPSYAFSGDIDSGMFLNAVGDLRLASAGHAKLILGPDDGTNGSAILNGRGTGTAALQHAGTTKLNCDGAQIRMTDPIRENNGTITAPSFAFNNSTNTGMYSGGVGDFRLAAAGQLAINFADDGAANGSGWLNARGTGILELRYAGVNALQVGSGGVTLPEGSAPATPATGRTAIYVKTDGLVYSKDDAGLEQVVSGGPIVCTSATRPASPITGMMIYETDTDRVYTRTAAATWRYVSGGTDPTAARGYATGATALVANTATKVLLAGESYDNGSNFATSTYTTPRAGLLEAHWGMAVTALADGQRFYASLFVAGAEVSRGSDGHQGAAAANAESVGSDLWVVTAGQAVEMWGFVLTTGRNTVAAQAITFLTCRMVP